MTASEKICNAIGEKFFCKDFVYENLKYFNSSNKKRELSDGLLEFTNFYVALQVKERGQGSKSNEKWLNEVVYGDAVEQILETVNAIKSNNIKVNDLYHQQVQIDKHKIVFPVIVFDNSSVTDYQRTFSPKTDKTIKINIFNMPDYQMMMETLVLPYDILNYLEKRYSWLEDWGSQMPDLLIGENLNSTVIVKGGTEESLASFFVYSVYDGEPQNRNSALMMLNIIKDFRGRQVKKNPDYKKILFLLQMINPKIAIGFVERFEFAKNNAVEQIMDYSKSIKIKEADKSTSIVFCSFGKNKEIATLEMFKTLGDAKQQQHEVDAVLIIAFLANSPNDIMINWAYYENEFIPNPELLRQYQDLGLLPK